MIEGVVLGTTSRRGRGRLRILTARVADDTGEIKATWFNQPWLEAQLVPGTRVRLRGKPSRYGFQVASYDLGEVTETADYAPVYPASEALAQKQLRALVGAALELVRAEGDALPAPLATTERLPLRADALVALHRPRSPEEAEVGRRRLAFDELLVLQLALARRAAERELLVAEALPPAGELLRRYREVLPFTLTEAQERAIAEIDRDLARTTPMQRLLQGDVGSGKTVVALATLLRAVEAGRQGALMAPTEVLAEQHFLTIEGICTELGVRVALLTSALSAKEHANVRQLIASGDVQIAVGTHALIQREVGFRDLAVAVVDEQHRFGVEQRSALAEGRSPHVLHMTATPIPRTLALTVYGDLSVSEITAPPANRRPIVTAWVTDDRSSEAYERLTRHLADGRQAYVVCPLIEASETTRGPCRRGRGRAAAPGRAEGVLGRLPARASEAGRAALDHGGLQGGRDRRARRHDRDRGRRRRAERDDHDRAGGRPLRPGAAPPAPRPGRAWGGAVVLPPRLRAEGGADGRRPRPARGDGARRATASSSPSATSRSAVRASCSAPASRASPTSASPGCARTPACSSGARGGSPRASRRTERARSARLRVETALARRRSRLSEYAREDHRR